MPDLKLAKKCIAAISFRSMTFSPISLDESPQQLSIKKVGHAIEHACRSVLIMMPSIKVIPHF